MKFNIEIELDWIGEDGTIDDAIKASIEESIISRISKEVSDEVKSQQKKRLHEAIQNRVDEMVNATFEELMSLQVVQTDNYGEATKSFPSVREMIKAKFDNYISETVDSKTGKIYNHNDYSKGKAITRLDYVLQQTFGEELDKKMRELASKVDKDTKTAIDQMYAKMKETLEHSVKGELGQKVAELLNINEVLKLSPAGKP